MKLAEKWGQENESVDLFMFLPAFFCPLKIVPAG